MGIGRPNAKAIAANPRGRVVALCDLFEERMDEFAAELPEPVKKYTDYHEMCRDPEIDAVFVGLPNQLHAPVAIEAMRHDKHVLVTKPLADSEAAAREVVEVAQSSGVVNMMSLSTRFGADCRYLSELAEQQYFGDLYYARARSVRRRGIPAWNLGFIQAGGGAFRDMGVHVLDAAWWLMGAPKPVSVLGVAGAKFGPRGQGYWNWQKPNEATPREVYEQFAADDYGGGFITFENGAGLQVESFWASHHPEEFQIELFGSEAGAQLSPLTLFNNQMGQAQDSRVEIRSDGETPWNNIAAHFIDCILDGKTCEAPLSHGFAVQRMMEALLSSAQSGHEVRVD
jgi:predicted dehydrogenase